MYNLNTLIHYNNEVKVLKKLFVLLISISLLVGCSFMNGPRESVDKLFKKYQALDEDVMEDLELASENSIFTNDEQRKSYSSLMEKQFSDMKYEITNEEIDGEEAIVTVNINVYDYYKAQKEADDYLILHRSEFVTNDIFDSAKFLEYKIKKMMDTTDRIEYTVKVNLNKKDKEWVVDEFDTITLKKIHGTYNYENN